MKGQILEANDSVDAQVFVPRTSLQYVPKPWIPNTESMSDSIMMSGDYAWGLNLYTLEPHEKAQKQLHLLVKSVTTPVFKSSPT